MSCAPAVVKRSIKSAVAGKVALLLDVGGQDYQLIIMAAIHQAKAVCYG